MSIRRTLRNKVVSGEILGFLAAILTCWVTEMVDPPFNLQQVIIETVALLILGWSIVHWTIRSIDHIRELEGFVLMCASCKSVKLDGKWVKVESVLGDQTLKISHGICPSCFDQIRADFRA